MLELCTVDSDVGCCDDGGLELGLGLSDVALYGEAAVVAIGCNADSFLVLRDGVVEEMLQLVVTAQIEVVEGELGLEREQDVCAVGGRGLQLLLAGGDVVADLAPKVDLVIDLERILRSGR